MTKTKLGLGLAALGRPDYINIRLNKDIDKSKSAFKLNALQILDKSYALGIRDFDVAPSYGLGESFLNEWNSTRSHTNVNLSTKFGYTYVANWDLGFSGKHEIKEHSLAKLNEQWKFSKALLPQLKIYQIHSATLESGVFSNKDVLDRLYDLKKRHHLKIGISSSGPDQNKIIDKALSIKVNEEALFDSFQVTYNLFEQSCFKSLKKLCNLGKTVIIKEALANGRVFRNKRFPHYENAYTEFERLSKFHEVGVDALALRFVIDSITPTLVLSGGTTIHQIKENYKALDFQLKSEDISELKNFAVKPKAYWDERSKLEWN